MATGSLKFFFVFMRYFEVKNGLHYLVQPLEEHTDGVKEDTEQNHRHGTRGDSYGFIDFYLTQMVLAVELDTVISTSQILTP